MNNEIRESRDDVLVDYVRRRVVTLQQQYARGGTQPTAFAAGTMAALRRADPRLPGDDPALWEFVLGEIPEGLTKPGSQTPTPYESAAHAALCLYAVHQQSRTEPMHVLGRRFGQGVRDLARQRAGEREPLSPGVVKKFQVIGTAVTPARRLGSLRSLLTLMRSASPGIGLDYGLLARDLRRLSDPALAPGVRLAWGRDLRRLVSPGDGADATPDTPANPTDTH
ncbi:MAG: type I-E CRISPR-associated protein Cse2/CasB [Dermatophilus congolensis]|nr:type I-E CRISPR-associated protein Cse2/CasB [Dermatophilus congolensis]